MRHRQRQLERRLNRQVQSIGLVCLLEGVWVGLGVGRNGLRILVLRRLILSSLLVQLHCD